jgi:hypothetical protein
MHCHTSPAGSPDDPVPALPASKIPASAPVGAGAERGAGIAAAVDDVPSRALDLGKPQPEPQPEPEPATGAATRGAPRALGAGAAAGAAAGRRRPGELPPNSTAAAIAPVAISAAPNIHGNRSRSMAYFTSGDVSLREESREFEFLAGRLQNSSLNFVSSGR